MRAVSQIAAVMGINIGSMRSRMAASSVIVGGMAVAVGVALSIFSMSAGLTALNEQSASPDRMLILSQGAIDGGPSNVPRDSLPIIADTPGVLKGDDGKPVVAGEIAANYITRKKANGVDVFVLLRGTSPNLLSMRPDIQLVEGRMFKPGLREVVAGAGAVAHFENVALGSQIVLADGPWTIVGIVRSSSSLNNYLLLADADTLMSSLRRNTYTDVLVRLDSGGKAAQESFKSAVKSNPALSIDVESEVENLNRNTQNTQRFYSFLAYGVGAIMGLGVIFAALDVMYAAVAARIIEIATLRAIGFGAAPVVVSIVAEALALAAIGSVIGAFIAWMIFNGRDQEFGPIGVNLAVTPAMAATGVAVAIVVGAIGSLFPAIRAARLPVATALQVR